MIKILYPNDEIINSFIKGPPPSDELKYWISCEHLEIVRVFYEGQYEQIIVDETGALTKLPLNQLATVIYHENVRVHQPELLINAPNVYGIAVLLTGENKLL